MLTKNYSMWGRNRQLPSCSSLGGREILQSCVYESDIIIRCFWFPLLNRECSLRSGVLFSRQMGEGEGSLPPSAKKNKRKPDRRS